MPRKKKQIVPTICLLEESLSSPLRFLGLKRINITEMIMTTAKMRLKSSSLMRDAINEPTTPPTSVDIPR
jgi:hypothetical protein